MTRLKYYDSHPPTPAPYTPPRLSRDQINLLLLGKRAAGPQTAAIVDDIVAAQLSLDIVDSRRDSNGNLSAADKQDYDTRSAPLQRWYHKLGLYPAPSQHTRSN